MNVQVAKCKTLGLYFNSGWKSLFNRIRFWDAPYFEVEKYVPKLGRIVELGSGDGLFSNFIAICSKKRKITGYEVNYSRFLIADRGLKNVNFKNADVTNISIPKSDCIVMFHLLHHLNSRDAQERLIEKSKNVLKNKGRLIIVEIGEKPFLKYVITWLTDHFIVPWFFEKKVYQKNIFFRSENEWARLLKEKKLNVNKMEINKMKPFPHLIFIATNE